MCLSGTPGEIIGDLRTKMGWTKLKLSQTTGIPQSQLSRIEKGINIMIRKANEKDLNKLLQLYTQLHNNPLPKINSTITAIWDKIILDDNHYIIVAENDDNIISSCVLVIIPNLTHNQQPYAIIENVITDEQYRNMGYATKILDYAKQIAIENNCYKIMLMTSSKQDSTLNFYRKAGYNSDDKTAFIQWL